MNAALQAAVLPLDYEAMNSIQFSTNPCEDQSLRLVEATYTLADLVAT